MVHIKYEFTDEATYETAKLDIAHEIEDDGEGNTNFYFISGDTIAPLGNITLTPATFDEDGNELTAPVLSDKWHVDVLWAAAENEPDSWKAFAVTLSDLGIHGFAGVDYLSQ